MALVLTDTAATATKLTVRRRAAHGLGELHVALLLNAMAGFPKGWSIGTQEDYRGELTFFVVSEREDAPMLVITRSPQGFDLAWNVVDDLIELGSFARLGDVMTAVARELGLFEERGAPTAT